MIILLPRRVAALICQVLLRSTRVWYMLITCMLHPYYWYMFWFVHGVSPGIQKSEPFDGAVRRETDVIAEMRSSSMVSPPD